MPRVKLVSDLEVFAIVRGLIAASGDKAPSFGAVSRATGLAGPTLVQRFGSQDRMVHAALMAGWDALDHLIGQAEAEADLSPKGAQALLKSLTGLVAQEGVAPALFAAHLRDTTLRGRATLWRARLEQALALRLAPGEKGQELASIVFSAWQGQLLWQHAGGKGFRIKDVIKRLT